MTGLHWNRNKQKATIVTIVIAAPKAITAGLNNTAIGVLACNRYFRQCRPAALSSMKFEMWWVIPVSLSRGRKATMASRRIPMELK